MSKPSRPHDLLWLDLAVDPANRITLPTDFTERLSWIKDPKTPGWLSVVPRGRLRFLSDEQVRSSSILAPIRAMILGEPQPLAEPSHAEPENIAAMVARLFPLSIAPQDDALRMTIPKALSPLLSTDWEKRKMSLLLVAEGYWELWYPDAIRKAYDMPLE